MSAREVCGGDRAAGTEEAARVRSVLQRLRETYPTARCELEFGSPLELLIATILSAQCSDRQVNRVTRGLFRRYGSAQDYASASLEALEEAIRALGLFRNKARHIQSCCAALVQRHGGEVPRTMEALVALSGVGRKTANVVLGNAFGQNDGIVVDTHVGRLARRLGLTDATRPEAVERALMAIVPREDWTRVSHWLIWHGRRRCGARRPDCAGCELQALCPGAARLSTEEGN